MDTLEKRLHDFLALYSSPDEETWARDLVREAIKTGDTSEVEELLQAMIELVDAKTH